MRKATIELQNLTLGYNRHPAVHHVSGQFEAGCLTAIVGPNGAGKSTLLKGISGALRPLEGRVQASGGASGNIAFLPQQAQLDSSFPISVLDTVCMGFWREVGLFSGISNQMVDRALTALQAVGLEGIENRLAGNLSRGQFQRLLFARLLVQDAPIMLLDEPFTAIDEPTSADLLAVIHSWHNEGRSVIAVLHDMAQVREHFPDTLLLARECIGWGATEQVLCAGNLAAARNMSGAWQDDAAICERDEAA